MKKSREIFILSNRRLTLQSTVEIITRRKLPLDGKKNILTKILKRETETENPQNDITQTQTKGNTNKIKLKLSEELKHLTTESSQDFVNVYNTESYNEDVVKERHTEVPEKSSVEWRDSVTR